MSVRLYLGADCGMDGGLITLDQWGQIKNVNVMPTVKPGKGRKIDLRALDALLVNFKHHFGGIMAVLEDPGGHAPSAAGLRSMTYSFAAIETLLVAHDIPHEIVRPLTWQKTFWSKPKMPKGEKFDTKAAALSAARRLWPEQDWTPTERATRPHDGLIDAALIAEYGRRERL